MPFLDELKEVARRVRAGHVPPLDELLALKARNKANALAAEAEDRPTCDSLPVWIEVMHSTVCNLKCVFCNQAYGKGVDWRMGEQLARRIVEELYPAVEAVQFTAYGEPMMTPKLLARIEEMERFGVRLELVTNATLMRGDRLLERMARVLRQLTVSIDGASPATYDTIRIGASFDAVIANLERYNTFRHARPREQQAPLHFNTILMRKTLDELPRFLRLAKRLDAQHVTVNHLVVFEEEMRGQMLSTDPEWRRRTNEVIEAARELARSLELSVNLPPLFVADHDADGAPARLPEPVRCWFLWQRLYVGPNGDCAPCALSGIHAIGNAAATDFPAIWNNAHYQELRRRVHTADPCGPCADCYLTNRSPQAATFDKTA